MKKIKWIVLFLLIFFMFSLTKTIKADMFPKATLNIEVKYEKSRDLYIELLYENKTPNIFDDYFPKEKDYLPEELISFLENESFENYISGSLYYSMPFFIEKNVDKEHIFNISYMYPKTFRVLIYDKTNNSVFITNVYSQTKFDTKLTIKLPKDHLHKNYENITVVEHYIDVVDSYNWAISISSLILRLLLTIGLEVLILFLFRYREKRTYNIVLITNTVTQLTLTLLLFLAFYSQGAFAFLMIIFVLEFFVILVETIIYAKTFKEKGIPRAVLYGILANTVTIAVGFLQLVY